MAREMKGVANMIHVSMCKNHRFNARMSMAFSFQNFIQISVQFSGSLIATHIYENTINLTGSCHTQLVARPSEIIIFFSISDSTMRKDLVSVLQILSHIRKNTKILYFLRKKYYLSRKFLKNLLFPNNLYNHFCYYHFILWKNALLPRICRLVGEKLM